MSRVVRPRAASRAICRSRAVSVDVVCNRSSVIGLAPSQRRTSESHRDAGGFGGGGGASRVVGTRGGGSAFGSEEPHVELYELFAARIERDWIVFDEGVRVRCCGRSERAIDLGGERGDPSLDGFGSVEARECV